MDRNTDRGLLVVSFGTSVNETREKNIDAIERELASDFPDRRLYRAWTSGVIIRKLKRRDGLEIDTVREAMERMLSEGITDLLVQPSHVICGIENDHMTEEIMAYAERFARICIGSPLLSDEEDSHAIVAALMEECGPLAADEALVFMGHGTPHDINPVYEALDRRFKDMGHSNVFVGTVEAYPSFESLVESVRACGAKRVILTPFMVVAGDHALNDMAGPEDSWRERFRAAGFEVECVLKGLGEYESIRRLYVKHAEEALNKEQVG